MVKPKQIPKKDWWDKELAQIKAMLPSTGENTNRNARWIEFERCKAQHEREMRELKNGENDGIFRISEKDFNDIITGHEVEIRIETERIRELTLKEVFVLLKQTRWMSADRKSWLWYLNKIEKELGEGNGN